MARAKKVESIEVEKPTRRSASAPAAQEEGGSRRLWIFRGLGVIALAVCAGFAMSVSRKAVDQNYARVEQPPRVVFVDRPAWLSDAVFQRVLASVTPPSARSSLDHDLLEQTVHILKNEPWVKQVRQVRRAYEKGPGDSLVIDCEFRAPVAFVRDETVERYWMVDASGVVLPESYRAEDLKRLGYGEEAKKQPRQIVGVKTGSPPAGQVWQGEDLKAGIEMVLLMYDKPFMNEVIEVDVTNFAGRMDSNFAHLVLRTNRGKEIRWGRPVSAPDAIVEVSAQQKLDTLARLYQKFDRVDAHEAWVDLRFDTPLRPKDSEGMAGARE
jgi:hypothetical protein